MHVVFSHEQGDFDSLGALLGASLLEKTAQPFVQRRYNCNVRSFLTLYETELPFLNPGEFPNEPIESIFLVDTQSMPPIKRITKNTRVTVLDHHPLRDNLPSNWKIVIDPVGACTTLLVEKIQAQSIKLSAIQATLMLLGIYEDTGSMTYDNTTSRDLQAAAYLLGQGASLRIAGKFLNLPLSHDQQTLFDKLLATIETLPIHGQKIMIASAIAADMHDEVSSVAHKLRDLLDPDGLIMIVQIREGIRLVTRSTSEYFNAAKIATHFGGGGHERAAAALIHSDTKSVDNEETSTFTRIRSEVIQILPHIIEPAITVGQIMSARPLVLNPQTTAEEASKYMQRYGYEGYPVVKNGRVVGLLTRHAVDRTLAHKMNLTVSSLMDAGEVTVSPDHTIEQLQRIMTSSGWGQVPVVDAENKKVIGIVTRTDLFNSMSGQKTLPPSKQNLAGRLTSALPPARLALLQTVAQIAHSQQRAIYIVGGFVRDLLLDRPCVDFDLVVEGNAIDLGNLLAQKFGGRIISHKRFGTAKWSISDIRPTIVSQLASSGFLNPDDLPDCLDLISARREFYDYPTALPTVERSGIKLDLHRRDFTINTMALRLDGRHYGELYDFWGGYNDLGERIIRVLHPLSFVDDPTRIIRAVRFEQRFGFKIEERTLQLLEEARHLLAKISAPRVRHELDLIFLENDILRMLTRLEELGLLAALHPQLKWWIEDSDALLKVLKDTPDPNWQLPSQIGSTPLNLAAGYLIWLHRLPQHTLVEISHRLNLSQKITVALQSVSSLVREISSWKDIRPSQLVRRLKNTPPLALYVLFQLEKEPEIKELLSRYAFEWRNVHPIADGNFLRSMKIPPGPAYQNLLEKLRDAWLDGHIHSEEEEKIYLSHLLEPQE